MRRVNPSSGARSLILTSSLFIGLSAAFASTPHQSEKPPAEPADSSVYVNPGPAKCTEIGNFYLKQKKYKAAISRFQEAVDTDPNYAAAYIGLGRAYEKLGQNKKALESYHKYLDMLPSDKDAEKAKDVQHAIERLSGGGHRGS